MSPPRYSLVRFPHDESLDLANTNQLDFAATKRNSDLAHSYAPRRARVRESKNQPVGFETGPNSRPRATAMQRFSGEHEVIMTRARFASVVTLLACLFLLLPMQSFGQAVYGSIFGTVTDPSGAVIPNAKVTVTDVRKGTSDAYTTNGSGNYSATHLIPDVYTIKIEAQGFTSAQSDNIQVSADTGAKFDATLKTGAQTETVQVTAEAPQLKT